MARRYEVLLGTYGQSDDLRDRFEESNGDAKQAFARLAAVYENAANICRQISNVVESNTVVEPDIHFIGILLEEPLNPALAALVAEGNIEVAPWLDDIWDLDETSAFWDGDYDDLGIDLSQITDDEAE